MLNLKSLFVLLTTTLVINAGDWGKKPNISSNPTEAKKQFLTVKRAAPKISISATVTEANGFQTDVEQLVIGSGDLFFIGRKIERNKNRKKSSSAVTQLELKDLASIVVTNNQRSHPVNVLYRDKESGEGLLEIAVKNRKNAKGTLYLVSSGITFYGKEDSNANNTWSLSDLKEIVIKEIKYLDNPKTHKTKILKAIEEMDKKDDLEDTKQPSFIMRLFGAGSTKAKRNENKRAATKQKPKKAGFSFSNFFGSKTPSSKGKPKARPVASAASAA